MKQPISLMASGRLLLLLACVGSPAGCSSCLIPRRTQDDITRAVDDITRAVNLVDEAINTINENSAAWQTSLNRVSTELPASISATIRNDVQNLATRSIAQAGTEIRCSVDFLGRRTVQALRRIRAELLNEPVPAALPPAFCQVAPAQIALNDPPAQWSSITFHGYDLDARDTAGNLVEVAFVSASGEETPLPASLVGRTTHYQLTVNLGTSACELHRRNIRKVILRYGGQQMGSADAQGEVVIAPWRPATRDAVASFGATTHVPPHTRGDGDFDTDDDEPMTIDARGEAQLVDDNQRINVRVFLRAHEPRPDFTTAEGWSPWGTAYEAPANWRIESYAPNANAAVTAQINSHGEHGYDRPGGEIVSRFTVYGDGDGDEAGSRTNVQVRWRNVTVHLVERGPTHLCPTP